MSLIEAGGASLHLHTAALEVFDVVGAGDTVIAALACVTAAGGGLPEAAACANIAAGIVVGKRDTATVAPGEVLNWLARLCGGRVRDGSATMLDRSEAIAYATARRAEGKRVGLTNGIFDLVHPGHIALLRFARDACDVLIVGVNSDASVRRLGKEPKRPINGQMDRALVLGAFETVDVTIIFDEDTPIELIRAIRPDVLVKGADYSVESVVGSDIVLTYGGEVCFAPLMASKSSTEIIRKAKSTAQ
jgi:D-beta-D-heptose 7-phosphate kinase/D-beta-D-heptose 1-phosphate adenosyltransferase